eukprot:CAMPEP_0204587944 /NCGR_PEP_ID=MMETSP0661-20131031/48334_1 /ASSEMBLY_ACC=CAM_ASM_000606 /TAXON_ID=109239 /ORGANISM="Alexandrium margalefi, Strain AMGDE01CS-322" /LENGTH=333 /DNA_ID=CAMNT_0051597707 /DNA_START=40 /DNA_END=1041 /DNA_ORIENTATION=-
MAAEAYQRFIDFDWSDERWQSYLGGLYPPPNHKQVVKFKKKWYKRTVDADFDEAYEPEGASSSSSGGAASSSGGAASSSGAKGSWPPPPSFSSFANVVYNDGARWAVMGPKATICFVAYAVALTMAVGAVAGVFPAYQALVVLVGALLLEILAKYGLKFNGQYVKSVVLDDVGVMPIMALTLLTPGMHPAIRLLALVPAFLTALMSFAQICKAHARLPSRVRDFFSPLAEVSARYQVMQVRADAEVVLGFVLIGGMFTGRAVMITVLLFWNFMMMRYMMSSWTQASFRKIDRVLSVVLGRIPGVRNLYALVKRQLYSYVDPESRKGGHLCTIL